MCLFLLFGELNAYPRKTNFEVTSPNGEIKVSINLGDKIYYSILAGNEVLFEKNHLGLILKNEMLGLNPNLLHLQQPRSFKTSYKEELFTYYLKDSKPSDEISTLPVLADSKNIIYDTTII